MDQRGTGRSSPLACLENIELDPYILIPENLTTTEIQQCLDALPSDLSHYTSENAIRDFDAVRAALGHEKVHIYGGSYGTRAALVYMRLFPESLQTVTLDSVGPVEVPIGLFGQSASRSFDLLLKHCKEDAACNNAFPNLRGDFDAVVAALKESPIEVTIPHPTLGTPTRFVISKSRLISTVRLQLYSTRGRYMVPLIISQAAQGNYLPLAGLVAQSVEGLGMYVGLTFNIVCSEDLPRVTEQMKTTDADNTFGQDDSHSAFNVACSVWPKYQVDEAFYEPVTANIPTLILSGNLDPVTPPSNGDFPAKTLPNNKHIVLEHASHTVAMSTCASDLVAQFVKEQDPKALDESCLALIENLAS